MAQNIGRKRTVIYVLIAVGFAGLIGAHEVSPADVSADTDMTLPLVLAAIGTLSFIVAGVMAFRMLKRGG